MSVKVFLSENAITFFLEDGPVVVQKGSHAYYAKIRAAFERGNLDMESLDKLLDIRTNDNVEKAIRAFKQGVLENAD